MGTPYPGPSDLVGRDDDLRLLAAFLERVADPGGALTVVGDAGVGKSALVGAVAEMAAGAGIRVIDMHGGEFRADRSFAASRELLAPLQAQVPLLTPGHQAALDTALSERPALDGSAPPARGTLGSAVLALMRAAAAEGPLLLLVDDAQWIDPASAELLAFVARRLTGTRAGLLALTRPGFAGAFESTDLPQHRLTPLADQHAQALLQDRHPGLAEPVRNRVLAEAAGNPLVLLELPYVLDTSSPAVSADRQRSVADVARLFGPRVTALPEHTRELLLLAALEGSGDLVTVRRAAGEDILSVLSPAEHSGLVRVEDGSSRLTFRHPLVSTTLVELSNASQRRDAHSRISAALTDQPDRRVWHLAGAAAGPDESVALLLEQQSRLSLARGDARSAERLLQRAAELSPEPASRADRQVRAAYLGADITGDLAGAAQLLAAADEVEPALTRSLPTTLAATYLLLNAECEVDTAHRLLVTAVDAHPTRHSADALVEESLQSLVMMSWFGGRRTLWSPFLRAVQRLDAGPPPLVDLVHRCFGDPVHQGRDALPALADALRHVGAERDQLKITRIGLACVYTDRTSECRHALHRVVDGGRDGPAVALAINALVTLCVDGWLSGRWDEVLDLAERGVQLCEQHGYRRYSVILAGYVEQLVRVARGDLDGGDAAAGEMAEWAAERGAGMTRLFAEHLYSLRASALGDFEAAYHHATRVSAAGELVEYNPHALWLLFDLVESACRTDRHAEAAAHVAAMREHHVGDLSPRLRMLVDGCTALTCTGSQAGQYFESALAVEEGPLWPFDQARVQLAYGEHLHLGKDPAAGTVLSAAAATFRRLGARPWETRALTLLRASGTSVGVAGRSDPAAVELTAAEREIAELAARGLTNRQIGEQLYLSPRSVGAALYRIFPKLGVTSRAALSAALMQEQQRNEDATWP